MSEYSRAQEREEKRRAGSGLRLSVFGLVLCWAPFLGVLLASIGFVRVASALTTRDKSRQRMTVIAAVAILAVTLAVTTAEVYQYTHNPWMLQDMGDWIMTRLTGESNYDGGYDYSNRQNPSMGMSDDLYAQGYTAEGYYDENGVFVPYAEGGNEQVGADETGG